MVELEGSPPLPLTGVWVSIAIWDMFVLGKVSYRGYLIEDK